MSFWHQEGIELILTAICILESSHWIISCLWTHLWEIPRTMDIMWHSLANHNMTFLIVPATTMVTMAPYDWYLKYKYTEQIHISDALDEEGYSN